MSLVISIVSESDYAYTITSMCTLSVLKFTIHTDSHRVLLVVELNMVLDLFCNEIKIRWTQGRVVYGMVKLFIF